MSGLLRRLRWWLRPNVREAELREEIQFHLDEEAEQQRADGKSDEQARWGARRELGNPTLVREDMRAVWIWVVVEQFGQDLRYALRNMAANRLFTALAALSLALGIGANAAIFSFMDAVLLRALPVPDPTSLVVFNWHAPAGRDTVVKGFSGDSWEEADGGSTAGVFPFPAFELFQKQDSLFASIFAHYRSRQTESLNLAVNGQSELAAGWTVTGDYFQGLGLVPAAGRLISPDDNRIAATPVAVISYRLSESRFGGPVRAVGQSVAIDGEPFTVIGVTPPDFFGVDPAAATDVFLPLHSNELLGASDPFGFRSSMYFGANFYWLGIMARLRPGVTREQAQATLAPLFHQWVANTASNDKERAHLPVLKLTEGAGGLESLRRKYSKPLYLLLTLVALILALACANVANLLLARASARKSEIALRLSLGASRGRVIRQLLTESILLGTLGGAAGMVFAVWGMRFLSHLLANRQLHAELNWHVLGAVAVLSLVTSVLFGLVPALDATRVAVMPALKATSGAQGGTRYSPRRLSLRHLLVMGQISISLLMLVAAGLFVRTLSNMQSIELGFSRENLLLFQVDARRAGHKDPEILDFYANLRDRLGTIPGVREATLEGDSPLTGSGSVPIRVAGALKANPANRYLIAGPGYFATMQIPLLAGRDFRTDERRGARAVAVVNQTFVKANLAGRNPIGQHLLIEQDGKVMREMEIVGVSRDARYGGLTDKIPPVVYMRYDQGYPQPEDMTYVLRTAGDPLRYLNSIRAIVRQADPRIPLSEIRTQTGELDRIMNQEIVFADLGSAFAALALLISTVGLYGTVSYDVARRTGEIGIRMALGAARRTVIQMILVEVVALATLGLLIGVALALGTSKFLTAFLYQTKANDPLSLTLAVLTLLSAAILAGYFPAWRAARTDPLHAIRHE